MNSTWLAIEESVDGVPEVIETATDAELNERNADKPLPGFIRFADLGLVDFVTEDGLAALLGKACRESIKAAVERGELPPPVRLMGKNTWTVGAIVRHMEARLESESRKVAKLRGN